MTEGDRGRTREKEVHQVLADQLFSTQREQNDDNVYYDETTLKAQMEEKANSIGDMMRLEASEDALCLAIQLEIL